VADQQQVPLAQGRQHRATAYDGGAERRPRAVTPRGGTPLLTASHAE
jgi:hypothetical protein